MPRAGLTIWRALTFGTLSVRRRRRRARHEACGGLVMATFREASFKRAPKVVSTWAARMKVRLVFGLDELRENLLC